MYDTNNTIIDNIEIMMHKKYHFINRRLSFVVVMAVAMLLLIPVFVFATTIGTNVTSIDTNLTGNLKVGDGTPTVTLNGEDAYVEGTLEVDGATRFDGSVTAASLSGNTDEIVTLDANGALQASGFAVVPRKKYVLFEEFEIASGAHFSTTTNGAGAAISGGDIAGDAQKIGIANFVTGTDATGRASLRTSNTAYLLGGGTALFETSLRINNLSDGTERYQVRAGFIDSNTTESTDGVYFEYDDASSPNWIMVTANNGVRTKTPTTTVVVAGSYVNLKLQVNAAGTSVQYFINSTSVGTLTTNIPITAGRETGAGVQIIKSVGTTSRTLDLDFIHIEIDRTTGV